MKKKTCFRCGESKPETSFYRHPEMADGRLGKCKECNKADVRSNRLKRVDYYRKWDRDRARTAARKQHSASHQRRKREKEGPIFDKAHNALLRAVKRGSIKRPRSCSRCSKRGLIHAHHDDYTKPLEVMWLCPVCHSARHKELGRI